MMDARKGTNKAPCYGSIGHYTPPQDILEHLRIIARSGVYPAGVAGEAADTIAAQALDLIRVTEENTKLRQELDGMIKSFGMLSD